TYPSIPSIAGKIVLSTAQIGRMPVVRNRMGEPGCLGTPEVVIREQGIDIAGRTVTNNSGNGFIFDVPATAKIVSNRYDLTAGQSATVRWEGLPCIPLHLNIKFKVWTIPNGGGAPVNHDSWITAASGNSATFTPAEPGIHEVEALLVTLDGRSYLKKATPNVARFDVPSIPVRSPIAMGVGKNKVLICPAQLSCGVKEDNVVSYDILKRPDGSNASYSRVGTVTKEVLNRDCYADTTAIPNTPYQYVLQAILTGENKSDKSPPDKATARLFESEFLMDHLPLFESPMKFTVLVKNEGNYDRIYTHEPNVPVRIFGTGNNRFGDYCFLLTEAAANMGTDCVEATRESLFDKGILLNTGGNLDANMAQAWLRFTDEAYALQGNSKLIQVMLGDMAKKWELLTPAHQNKTFDAMTVPLEEIPLTQYQFHGDGLGYESKAQMYNLPVPVIPVEIGDSIPKMYFTALPEIGGLLASPAWRQWADANKAELWPTAADDISDFSVLSPSHPEAVTAYARAMASVDAIAMVEYDAQPGNCLFGTGCTEIDWLNYYDNHPVGRYLQPFLNAQPVLDDQNADAIARGHAALIEGFFADDQHLLEQLRQRGSRLAGIVDSIRIKIPSGDEINFSDNPDGIAARQHYSATIKPYLEKFVRVADVGQVGLAMGIIKSLAGVVYTPCFAVGFLTEGAGDMTAQCFEFVSAHEEEIVADLEKRLGVNEIYDPLEAGIYHFAELVPQVASMYLVNGEGAPVAKSFKRAAVEVQLIRDGRPVTLLAGEFESPLGQITARVALSEGEEAGAFKLVHIDAADKEAAVSALETAVGKETATIHHFVSKPSELKTKLDEAEAAGANLMDVYALHGPFKSRSLGQFWDNHVVVEVKQAANGAREVIQRIVSRESIEALKRRMEEASERFSRILRDRDPAEINLEKQMIARGVTPDLVENMVSRSITYYNDLDVPGWKVYLLDRTHVVAGNMGDTFGIIDPLIIRAGEPGTIRVYYKRGQGVGAIFNESIPYDSFLRMMSSTGEPGIRRFVPAPY
ncbi:MAG: hypothetical protein Q7T11_08960, partial [Deltaproteobacteria bacterium]|nr:hypothetical protein [Deltaproteobacteria bacterium]